MRLAQEHLFAQARNDAQSILTDWETGVITAQDAYNDIIKLKEAGTGYKTMPRYDFDNPHPAGSFMNDDMRMRKLVDYLTGMDIVSANDPPYLDQYDHDYIKKMYKDINNPKKPEETIPEPDEFIQGELDLANMPPDINTPYLPGGQRTDGIPNIDNPKLQDRLKKRKGIKGPTGATLPPIDLVQNNPPVLGERDAVIQKADELRKAGKTDEALDLYRHAATLPIPTV